MSIQVIGAVHNAKLQFHFDKRMTGSTAIDEVLHEVYCFHRHVIIISSSSHYCIYVTGSIWQQLLRGILETQSVGSFAFLILRNGHMRRLGRILITVFLFLCTLVICCHSLEIGIY